MAVLFEVHNEPELDKALAIDVPIIGVNNRDLTTLKINLETTFRLKTQIPAVKLSLPKAASAQGMMCCACRLRRLMQCSSAPR